MAVKVTDKTMTGSAIDEMVPIAFAYTKELMVTESPTSNVPTSSTTPFSCTNVVLAEILVNVPLAGTGGGGATSGTGRNPTPAFFVVPIDLMNVLYAIFKFSQKKSK